MIINDVYTHNLIIIIHHHMFSHHVELFHRDQSLKQRRFNYIRTSLSQSHLARCLIHHFSYSIHLY